MLIYLNWVNGIVNSELALISSQLVLILSWFVEEYLPHPPFANIVQAFFCFLWRQWSDAFSDPMTSVSFHVNEQEPQIPFKGQVTRSSSGLLKQPKLEGIKKKLVCDFYSAYHYLPFSKSTFVFSYFSFSFLILQKTSCEHRRTRIMTLVFQYPILCFTWVHRHRHKHITQYQWMTEMTA